jgi:hypothetical protein
VPGGGIDRDVKQRPYLLWGQGRRTLLQPADQLAGREDDDLVRSLSHGEARGIDHGDYGDHVDAEAGCSAEETARPLGLVRGVAQVRLLLAVDHEGAPGHPHLLAGVVLGVDGEDAARSDDDVVDV